MNRIYVTLVYISVGNNQVIYIFSGEGVSNVLKLISKIFYDTMDFVFSTENQKYHMSLPRNIISNGKQISNYRVLLSHLFSFHAVFTHP